MSITLKQVAELAGVSISTASRVANDLPGVSPLTRKRVLMIINEYGYKPDLAARSLASKRSQSSNKQ